jgi:LysM repeat protein
MTGHTNAKAFWILLAALSAFPPASLPAVSAAPAAGFESYQVRKGDSLWSIARSRGISPEDLKKANDLSDTALIRVGQTLAIPPGDSGYLARLCAVKRGVKARNWKYIVVHHSATSSGNAFRFDYFHRKVRHMERGMAYHFLIGNGRGLGDGAIQPGSRWLLQQPGGHVRSEQMNEVAIGICLVGNFDKSPPTAKQMQSLTGLLRYLQGKYRVPRSRVIGHREVKGTHTKCPGKHLSLVSLRQGLRP